MPDTAAVAIVDEPLVELQPPVVSAQEVETRHRLEPHQSERYVGLHRVSMRQYVAHDEMRLRDHLLSEELHRFLTRKCLGDPIVNALDSAEVLVPEDRHVCEHRQGIDRWRRRL